MATIKTLVAVVALGFSCWAQSALAQATAGSDRHPQQALGQASKNPQALKWASETLTGPPKATPQMKSNCACGENCQCLDEMICKQESCSKNYAVLFTARWCAACRIMYPMVTQLRNEGYIVYVLDVDDYPEAARLANAHSLPTTVIFDKGAEIQRHIGVTRLEVLKENLKTKDEQNTPEPPAPPQPPDDDPHSDFFLI